MIGRIAKLTLISTLLVAIVLSCHDSVTLPPVQGPPLKIPEQREKQAKRQLEVSYVTPDGQLSSPHTQVAVSFNKPMVSLQRVEDRAMNSPLTLRPEVVGKQRWLGSRTLIFQPDQPLPGSTTYALEVPSGIVALDGSRLKQGKRWSFTTPRLAVSRIFPSPGDRWVATDVHISLFFNQPVKPAVVQKHMSLLVARGRETETMTVQVREGKNAKHMVLQPSTSLPTDARVTVQAAAALTGNEGPLPMGKPYVASFNTYGPLRVLGLSCTADCNPDYSVTLRLSNPVPRSTARQAIRINGQPLRGGSSSYNTSTIYLDQKLKPRTRYTVTVAPTLTDRFHQTVQPSKPLSFTTGDYEPMVHMPLESSGVLEASGPRKLPIYFRNATLAQLTSKRLSDVDLATLATSRYYNDDEAWLTRLPGLSRQEIKVAARPNSRVVRRVDLGALLGQQRGVLALELRTKLRTGKSKQVEERISRALVRVTDLAVTAKYSPHATLVWVTSLQTGTPVPGCEVAIWRPGSKQPLWRGTADASGLALAPGMEQLDRGKGQDHQLIFFVRKDSDESYVLSSTQGGISPWDFGLDGTWENSDASLVGMLFTDRGIYRPGEAVQVKGLFRRSGPDGLSTPQGMKVKLTITDARGEKLKQSDRALGEFGSLDFRIQLPVSAPLGSYSVVGKAASGGTIYGSFSVEEYRPAEFKVEVKPERREYVRGDTLAWSSDGAYLFGAPMRGAQLRWYLHQRRSSYAPPGHEGYVFADEVRWWQDDESSSPVPLVSRGSGKLDGSGSMSRTAVLKPPRMTGPMTYEMETTVTDVSRQSISSRATVLLHPGEFYIGARPKETFIKAGDSLDAELLAVTAAGKIVTGKRISGTLLRRTWHSVRKQGMGGSQYFVTRPTDTPVGQCAVTSGARPQPCRIRVAQAGYHVMRLRATDPRGNPLSTSFGLYVAGPDYVPWRRENDDKVELVTDRKSYRVGQTARVLVKSPFAGAHGLFTVERSGIFTRRAFKLKGTSTWLDVPITNEMVPDAYVSVLLVRGRTRAARTDVEEDPGKPAFKVGYARLSISQANRRLHVTVTPGRKEYRPGQQVAVELQVKDARGKGIKAELTVMVADEGVLSLIGYRTPDPMSVFYAQRGLSVRTADNRLQLINAHIFGEKGKNPGGGGGGMGESGSGGVRRDFVSTPYFNPQVVTGEDGRARITFKLPDNLTTFRIMAVAASARSEFGNDQSQVRVNKPLLLLPALPRLVRVGDQIEAGVVVHNRSGRAGQVQVRAEVKGLTLTGPAMQVVSVKDGGAAEARFLLSGHHPTEAVLRFSAALEEHQDALELRRPVTLAMVTESVATSGSTTGAVAEGIVPTGGIRDDVGGLELAMSSSALVGLKGGVEYLLDYPYECAEQTTSRLVPLVLLKDLTRAYHIKGASGAEVDALAGKLVGRLQTLQRWNGGFSYWASSSETYPWASAYVTWGLARARDGGFKVSHKVLQRAAQYLKQQLDRAPPKQDADAARIDLNTRAFVVHVLAELGQKPTAYINNLFDHREDLAVFARAMLLSTVARLKPEGSQRMIDKLVSELVNQVHQTSRVAKVEENLGDGYAPLFHSNVRSSAMLLHALLAVRPDHPLVEKLVQHLMQRQKDGRWLNTQETVYCLLALQSYFQRHEKQAPDFVARVLLGEGVLAEQPFKGRSLEVKQLAVPMSKLARFKGPLGFIKQGDGRLYYTARLRYARDSLPTQPWDEGFYVTRTYERVPEGGMGSMDALRGDGRGPGQGVMRVKAGDLVRVTLRIIVPQQMSFVAVDDPLPAGLEAVNFRLVTSARAPARGADFGGFQPRYGHQRYSWYTPFYHQEIRDDRVQLFADTVPPGIQTYVYLARATTVGRFVAPPTHVEQMYDPEVFGRTAAGSFEVTR